MGNEYVNKLKDFDDSAVADMLPPEDRLSDPGDGDFILIGKHFVYLLKKYCNLKKKDYLLDVGCSVGRIAIPLTQYVKKYEGIDIIPASIELCKEKITSKYKDFRFKCMNIYNVAYNPLGKIDAKRIKFPYKSRIFDQVILVSVFTHMPNEELPNYIREISRVLKHGGKTMITYFLLDKNIAQPSRVFDGVNPVQTKTELVRKLYKKNNLKIDKILYGTWSNPESKHSYQDVVIATKI